MPRSWGLTAPPKLVHRTQAVPGAWSGTQHAEDSTRHTHAWGHTVHRTGLGQNSGRWREGWGGRHARAEQRLSIQPGASTVLDAPPDGRASLGHLVRGSGAGHVAGQGAGLTGAGPPSRTHTNPGFQECCGRRHTPHCTLASDARRTGAGGTC